MEIRNADIYVMSALLRLLVAYLQTTQLIKWISADWNVSVREQTN